MKALDVQFLRLAGKARQQAIELASKPPKRHHEPFCAGSGVKTHSHPDHFLYLLAGKGAEFRVILLTEQGEQVVEKRVLGDEQEVNAVIIPKLVPHAWSNANEGDQIHDVEGLEKMRLIPELQLA